MDCARLLKLLLLPALVWSAAIPASACIDFAEYDETAFLEADLIFVGDLTDYEIVTVEDRGRPQELAVLSYRVDEVLKGEAGPTIRLWWPNSTFGYPPALARYAATVVAAVPGKVPADEITRRPRYSSLDEVKRLPVVHQQPCASESIFPVSQTDITTIKRWIVTGAADQSELSYDGRKIVNELPARHTGQWDLMSIVGAVIGVGLLILALGCWRRRKAKALA